MPADIALPSIARSYLICTVPRAGSTLLCRRLRKTGLAGAPYEVFAPTPASRRAESWGTSSFGEYFDEFRTRSLSRNGVLGAKLMWAQCEDGVRRLRDEAGFPGGRDDEVLGAAFPHLRYVWLQREDKVRQGLSWWRAEMTDKWDTRRDTQIARAPGYDFAAIDEFVQRAIEHEGEWARWFAARGIAPHVVSCESITRQPERALHNIFDFLDVETPFTFGARRDRWTWRRTTQRQADTTTDAFAARYTAEKAAS